MSCMIADCPICDWFITEGEDWIVSDMGLAHRECVAALPERIRALQNEILKLEELREQKWV